MSLDSASSGIETEEQYKILSIIGFTYDSSAKLETNQISNHNKENNGGNQQEYININSVLNELFLLKFDTYPADLGLPPALSVHLENCKSFDSDSV